MPKMQTYVPSIRCPECGGVTIRTTQTRNHASGIRRKHVCKSLVRRLAQLVECGCEFESRQVPPKPVLAPVDKILTEFLDGRRSDSTGIRDELAAEGIKSFADLVEYMRK